jgi:hypothetical protein
MYIDAHGTQMNSIGGIRLERYGMHEIIDNITHFRVRLVREGTYVLGIFASDVTDIDSVEVRRRTYHCLHGLAVLLIH